MKLLSFEIQNRKSFGAVIDDGVIDLGRKFEGRYADLLAVLEADALPELEAACVGVKPDYALTDITFLPVIPNPPKIICIGVNYEAHRSEIGRDPSKKPMVFARFPASQIGHMQPLVAPPESHTFDYEGEIAIIIGKPGRRISQADSWSHIAGYAPYNDGSIREWQGHTGQWTPGKNWYQTGGFGPWMSTRGEIPDNAPLHLKTRVNGQEVQSADASQMIFSIPEIIEYCSIFTPLEAGDVIVTGTPGGVGVRRNPQLFLKDGDIVEVEISEIGILRNSIKAEQV
ncbi:MULTISPECIES: fumarylacetoacetate hydrolase family protein [Rhizobium/Agrobacterium group]|uniref:fumarylacetoacetate hydrolase family protein n=1 Tax=Rhizobium/Agrobacterium group TaxID=227290 RepID=UPI000B40101A|nr:MULTISPECIES: fumarylacetoacetate hydrolase family protein [Rhizobium/Agrobacterium group]MCF1483840.1 fumarylacetoacetate hydrolase family protein [Allorhizobium ampelinum]NSZ45990.1 fumarylacetoacetate hydrolase family protein [Agrobacterium vitis]NTA29705.1 fumarylacetoacetate hydrolase family protein [Allorhizobium ampelinum]OVE88679.1 5-carboxymethyl-2-hydroxymuconate isomerase [Allorhizobium ampelinum]